MFFKKGPIPNVCSSHGDTVLHRGSSVSMIMKVKMSVWAQSTQCDRPDGEAGPWPQGRCECTQDRCAQTAFCLPGGPVAPSPALVQRGVRPSPGRWVQVGQHGVSAEVGGPGCASQGGPSNLPCFSSAGNCASHRAQAASLGTLLPTVLRASTGAQPRPLR